MKKIIKQDKDTGIVQITIADERWYVKTDEKENKIFVPSVTWISGYYPKGIAFYKWLANKGWDEAEAIKQAAADKGSKVHQAICNLIDGQEVKMDGLYKNPTTDELEELTLEEYGAIMSFCNWYDVMDPKPRIIAREMVVFNDEQKYAGTCDIVCEIEDEIGKQLFILDLKTGQYIWPEHELQISAYKHALIGKPILDFEKGELITIPPETKTAILQLGYRLNKRGFKFTVIEDKYDLFLAAKRIWAEECSKIEPLKKDYPTSLMLKKEGDDADKGTE